MIGAHVIKSGLSRFVIDWMERGIVTHVAMNGAGPIHDFELALIGATTESVARYIQEGQFGLWRETGRINEAIAAGTRDGLGYGESVGRMIEDERFPQRGGEHPRRGLQAARAGDRSCRHRLRHYARAA